MNPASNQNPPEPGSAWVQGGLFLACLLVLAAYLLLSDLKGISTDEGFRMGLVNGGQGFTADEPGTRATWPMVLKAVSPHAYQPGYFLLLNTVERLAGTHDSRLLKLVNLCFLGVALLGLLALSKSWRLLPRFFLIGVFFFNAFLLMHVLQIREYVIGLAFYVWSAWFVLHLDRRLLGNPWADVAWFAGYGVLLTLGFYVQTWVVFPAIGQFLFLVVRRAGDRWRFYVHLGLSYFIVLTATWPYLSSHTQKANVGLWGDQTSKLWPQLSNGFHLVLSGHLAGHSPFTEFLCWFWLALVAGAALLFFRRKPRPGPDAWAAEFRREGLLMLLCSGVAVAFQIGYFLKVENLSVWPRYFVIHYFFLFWLIALGFRYLHDLRFVATLAPRVRQGLAAVTGLAFAVMLAAGIYQTRSYYLDPYLDTGVNRTNDWRRVAAAVARLAEPGDAVVTKDFVHCWTLSYTRTVGDRIIPAQDIEASGLKPFRRVIYLDDGSLSANRDALFARLQAVNFSEPVGSNLAAADGQGDIPGWRVYILKRG